MQIEKDTNSQACKRLSMLFDEGIYNEIGSTVKEKELGSGVVTAYGYVNGNAVYAFSQDKSVNSGAVGTAHANKIAKLYELAAKTGTPVVGIHDSNGAFMDGTASSLAAYSQMLNASAIISGVVPQISIITGTCAGTAAMLACSSDFVIMTKDSEFFMAPNSSVGSAELAAKSGIASIISENEKEAIDKARELINIMPINNLAAVPMFEFAEPVCLTETNNMESTIAAIADADSVIEISENYGNAAYTALATIGGSTVAIASTNKTVEKLSTNDCAKLARFMRTCDAFSIPVITFVDSEGFADSDVVSSIKSMTTLANVYAEATTAKIAVVTGKAIGPVFVALAGNNSNSDFTYAYEDAVIAPVAPSTAVEFMWHDRLKGTDNLENSRNELILEYENTLASAVNAAENNFIDEIINPSQLRSTLVSALDILSGKRTQKLPKKHNNIQF